MQVSMQKALEWSPYVERQLSRYSQLLETACWENAYADGELFQEVYDDSIAAENDAELMKRLRLKRNHQMTRIALRDLMGLADLQETLADLSDLADALVNAALDWHYERFCQRYGTPIGRDSGQPQKLLVIGMGKLGGQELNFSSDIDLIFAYPEGGETQGAARSISNEQFFIRLGQALNKSLVEVTVDGFVYRVDMRLRPFGDAGPLSVSFASLEHYYEIHGRAWERYALVKARIMAGDAALGEELFSILRPFVYRRYVDFSAMDSLRELKQMISDQVRKKGMLNNIKLGAGGIREVEFIVQAFQLVHGGRDRSLQGRKLMPMLQRLAEKGYLLPEVAARLCEAYVFLRRAENRLQEWSDQQTHELPDEANRQLALAEAMGFADYERFLQELGKHKSLVSEQFAAVFAEEEVEQRDDVSRLWLSEGSFEDETLLADWEENRRDLFLAKLDEFKSSRLLKNLSKDALERFNVVVPLILHQMIEQSSNETTLGRVISVLEAIAKRSVYLVLLKENPQAIKNLIKLCEISSWLTDMLVKYPALMDQLLDERTLYEPLMAEELKLEACRILNEYSDDEETFMLEIRQWRHAQVFRVAAADVTGHVPIMKVSDYLTWIAEAVLEVCAEYAWRFMCKKSGLPGGMSESDRNPFMVLGYGKLGGIELGYGSDLDIVMLYEGVSPSEKATSANGRQLDNSVYFIRMGQKLISLITTLMPAGVLYELDTRLRPNGASGMMVVSFDEFEKYIENKAWTWEHQALVRVRAVVGNERSVARFNEFKENFLRRERDLKDLKTEVIEMRNKMQEALDKSDSEQFDLKQGRGGIVDIEFMMQFLVLGYADAYPQLCRYSDNIRILEAVAECGLLDKTQVDALTEAYKVYRSKYHRLSLQNEKPLVGDSCYPDERQAVVEVWQSLMMS
ncbi:bifunctional [glutamate--ammonia ligase]-adenylyl-L-tyrosine phosphorylase/[glutamate--ammonia-ligase] adenylyltransferase [Thiomicrorhabdus heinhorstiae]|uniref:Bifunctional glutamine synthetase adenylyltransferase/adenylyl-removing enzyme n=1 Tax=Thiomicrorhabdus heinhorstiae TaxID=2748010 RepID=A0ABS0BTL6_9GAMM|nr:bifunctional [glutamate--ammonia ligase]-adenylyl-L-tyrosine phosphorylase/[glutamate--ammonia-ligase] adenylyltransferase [Thiomicrorhabdus heinhorstiae]MBF6057192.1 bifunctional [glutamate--ammonia ligase]-adenylyl-L-tyrosine phosphorylase/[glutamate--ammonia-ligase] adenylyltransferase [Thiomicrorhabdus heinhorstiae]